MCGPHCMDITRMKLSDIDIKFKLFSLYDQYQSKHGYKSRPRILTKEEALRQYNQCNCTLHRASDVNYGSSVKVTHANYY